jgi:hypothetical protein
MLANGDELAQTFAANGLAFAKDGIRLPGLLIRTDERR